MLDTRLKNRHKLAVILIICTILIPTFFVMSQYHEWYLKSEAIEEDLNYSEVTSETFLENFIEAGYILYNMESGREDVPENIREVLKYNYSIQMESFESLYPFLDYQVKDEEGKEIAKSIANSESSVTEKNLSSFALGMIFEYDENGTPDVRIEQGEYKTEQSIELRRLLNEYDDSQWEREIYDEGKETWENYRLDTPKNRTYIFAMTEENLKAYLSNDSYRETNVPDDMVHTVMILMLIVAAAALLYPVFPSLHTGGEKIFQAFFEVAVIVFFLMLIVITNNIWWMLQRGDGLPDVFDYVIWGTVFAIVYWTAACLRNIYTLGIMRYIHERTFFCISWKYIRRAWNYLAGRTRSLGRRIHRSITDIDLTEKSSKKILEIVLINFVVLALLCTMWFVGIMALVVYSVILFFVLRKYYDDIKEKYSILLKATNEIAEGNLDVSIEEDLGVFSPFQNELQKIQQGFKKAVDEEVKSQRMKTELITNVSHDLKTPLTAIITYVNLLKDEKDEEKQKDYIAVLERKSLRLKVLIEDLFEISKASSKNVTLNIVDVDVVNLFKQVKLELEDKITEAGLEFRCIYPEGKVIAPLDSQKTYRVFENLITNIIKYAMPHTRVYIEIAKEDKEVVVRMKNVSAAELNFNPEEITERFVRGDASRNTEGSGLGLAIAKSFVELQKGKFKVETEADLFKVEIRW